MIRIGLIGSGSMAAVYADRINGLDTATVTAVASPNTAQEFAAEHTPDATATNSAETLCREAELDAVAILSPTHLHREHCEIAAEHGLDIICEKPLARTMEDAHAIEDAVDDAGVRCMVAHVTRFFPEYATAKERIDAGEIGTPGVVRTQRAFGFEGPRGWFSDHEKSGGVLLDLAIHDFDYLRWVLGEVERVFTRTSRWDDGESESTVTMLRFESGAVGHCEAWTVQGPSVPFTTSFEFAGDDGLIEYENDNTTPIELYDADGHHVPRDPVGGDIPLREDGYQKQLDAFVQCVETQEAPSIPVSEGIESLRISLASIESAKRGEPVSPGEVGR